MTRRTSIAAGMALAVVSIAPLAGSAHAQDVNCSDFTYQEDAQSVYNQDPTDPNRLDEDRGADDGIACEVLPRRPVATAAASTPATSTPTASAPATGTPATGAPA